MSLSILNRNNKSILYYKTKISSKNLINTVKSSERISSLRTPKIASIGKGYSDNLINCKGKMVTSGFIDSHTHPVFYNKRDKEYAMRLSGLSYEEIAKEGGGFVSSVEGVRKSSKSQLIEKAIARAFYNANGTNYYFR